MIQSSTFLNSKSDSNYYTNNNHNNDKNKLPSNYSNKHEINNNILLLPIRNKGNINIDNNKSARKTLPPNQPQRKISVNILNDFLLQIDFKDILANNNTYNSNNDDDDSFGENDNINKKDIDIILKECNSIISNNDNIHKNENIENVHCEQK